MEVRIGDEHVFIEKKFIIVDSILSKDEPTEKTVGTVPLMDEEEELINDDDEDDEDDEDAIKTSLADLDFDDEEGVSTDENPEQEPEPEPEPEPTPEPETEISLSDLDKQDKESKESLQAKLKKSLEDLKAIKDEMKNTFTSTETISSTITSVKGIIDALKKDQLELQNSMSNESVTSPVESVKKIHDMHAQLIEKNTPLLESSDEKEKNSAQIRIDISKEWVKRCEPLMNAENIMEAFEKEKEKRHPNTTDTQKFMNQIWFKCLAHWVSLVEKKTDR